MRVVDLEPGMRVRIKRAFRDHDGREHAPAGPRVLVSHDIFAHDDGHTLRFDDGATIRLSGDDPRTEAVFFDHADVYWEIVRT